VQERFARPFDQYPKWRSAALRFNRASATTPQRPIITVPLNMETGRAAVALFAAAMRADISDVGRL
jgi:hypothetical protein